MTICSAIPILGRPFDDYDGPDIYELETKYPELFGGHDPDSLEGRQALEASGFRSLYQGNAYFGVQVQGGFDQGKPQRAEDCAITWTPEQEAQARAICDALPESLKARDDLMPFGAYFVSTDG